MSSGRLIWHAIPVLPYRDAEATIAFYRRLGFELTGRGEAYLVMHRAGVELHFEASREAVLSGRTACYLRSPNLDALYAEFTRAGELNLTQPEVRPYPMREFQVTDPDGNLLRFGQPTTE